MSTTILEAARRRYATKQYTDRSLSDADLATLKELLRLAPSSVNGQPWRFILATTNEGKARIVKAAEAFPSNIGTITHASHVVVFCSRLELDESYLTRLLEQEDADGRFAADPSFMERMRGGRALFVNIHEDLKDVADWNARQTYLNLGAFLLGVAALGLNATPMEGFDPAVMDEEFGLKEQGYQSVALVAIGFGSADDYNAALPKSRLPLSEILVEI